MTTTTGAAAVGAAAGRRALAMLAVLSRAWVYFTVDDRRLRLPLPVALYSSDCSCDRRERRHAPRAWQYPDQAGGWSLVHLSKFGSWSLLVSLSFALVATVRPPRADCTADRAPGPA